MKREIKRCAWAQNNELMAEYHDEEWGVPEWDSRALWEKLILDGFQAGLSWQTILNRREGFRKAFKGFDPVKVAKFSDADVERLMKDETIIRARSKIVATIGNAKAYLEMQKNGEDFSSYIWEMAGGKPIQRKKNQPVMPSTDLSTKVSKELKKRGFKFVGPVIVYAWMQATGIVNDHDHDCVSFDKCVKLANL